MDQINKGFQTGPVHSLLENPKILYWPQHLVDRVGVILLGQCPIPRTAKSKKGNFDGFCAGIQGIQPFPFCTVLESSGQHSSVLTCVPHYYATRSDLIRSSWKRVDFGQRMREKDYPFCVVWGPLSKSTMKSHKRRPLPNSRRPNNRREQGS